MKSPQPPADKEARRARRFTALPDPPCGVEKVWHLKMAKSRLGYVHCILEAYEGMAFVSTFDRESAVLEVAVMPGYDDDFQTLLAGLKNESEFEAVRMESRDMSRPHSITATATAKTQVGGCANARP